MTKKYFKKKVFWSFWHFWPPHPLNPPPIQRPFFSFFLVKTEKLLDSSLSIHLSSDLYKLNSDLFLRALPVSSHGPFCQFLLIARMVACAPHNYVWKNSMVCGAQALMHEICKNWKNGPWEDTGNALRNKFLSSLCKSDAKWTLSEESRKLFVRRKFEIWCKEAFFRNIAQHSFIIEFT